MSREKSYNLEWCLKCNVVSSKCLNLCSWYVQPKQYSYWNLNKCDLFFSGQYSTKILSALCKINKMQPSLFEIIIFHEKWSHLMSQTFYGNKPYSDLPYAHRGYGLFSFSDYFMMRLFTCACIEGHFHVGCHL